MWAVLISLTYIFRQSSAQPFYWSSDGAVPNKVCVQWIEAADTAGTWTDNYLCSDTDFGIRWSMEGAISGMTCTQILEPAEPDETTWDDNFLCVPPTSPLHFAWSSDGAISGKSCVQIHEPSDPHTWHDNYLCWDACDLLSCNNGAACDGEETCQNGGCVAGTPIDCGSFHLCDESVGGLCVVDCDSFDIDGHLECSASFASLQTAASNSVTRADGVDTRIDGVDSRIDGVDERIDNAFEEIVKIQNLRRKSGALYGVGDPEFAPQTGPSNFLDGFFGGETGANNLNGKDIFIIALLLLNLLVMSWLYCCKCVKSNKYRKAQVFDDSEAQQLRM